jgi:hypothetical protein
VRKLFFAMAKKRIGSIFTSSTQIRIQKIAHSRHNTQEMRKHQLKAVVVTPRNALFLLLT